MKKENIDRRGFLKRLGLGISAAGLSFAGCDNGGRKFTDTKSNSGNKQPGDMTYRINHNSGDKVS